VLTFRIEKTSLDPGMYWARLLVEGIESLLIDRTKMPPVFDKTQAIVIPIPKKEEET
jgi:hypothetical protein